MFFRPFFSMILTKQQDQVFCILSDHYFSINKQSLWTDIFQIILINIFDLTNTTTDIYYQMEVQLTELESIKTKLITERNDVAAVVRRELAKTCLMT